MQILAIVWQSYYNGLLKAAKKEIVFSKPAPFSPGDILISGISDKTPNGLLRKVEKVDSNTIYTKMRHWRMH